MISNLFHNLHTKAEPLILYNIWDAGSAKAVASAGAAAIATGSWSVAAANGFTDGEMMPIDAIIENIHRITAATELPVSLDFEGGYADNNEKLANNIKKILATNIAGINFEDQIVGSNNIYPIDIQSERIKIIRKTADTVSNPLFINARTDLFLKETNSGNHYHHINNAIERSKLYHQAGANGFFVPGLIEPSLIQRLCAESPIPINIMITQNTPDIDTLKKLGVARISYGPVPYLDMMATLQEKAKRVFSQI